jgi:hypothetical protein
MSVDPLEDVLAVAERQEGVITGEVVRAWGKGVLESLTAIGLLQETELAREVVCDACAEAHSEEVIWSPSPHGSPPRPYVACNEAGRALVDPFRLRQWVVEPEALARWMANRLRIRTCVECLEPSRIWRLGKLKIDSEVHELFVGRGLSWRDGERILETVRNAAVSPMIVFAPVRASTRLEKAPRQLLLREALSLEGGRLDLVESAFTLGRVAARPVIRPVAVPPGAKWEQVQIIVRDDLSLDIVVGSVRERRRFNEAGFEDRRKGNSSDYLWGVLRTLGACRGRLKKKAAKRLSQTIYELRKRLRALVPIPDDPISVNREKEIYETRFRIRREGVSVFRDRPQGVRWDQVAITENPDGTIHVTAGEEADDFGLVDLTLETDNGIRDEACTFQQLLRSNGSISRPQNDRAMLRIDEILRTMMGLLDSSAFTSKDGVWRARFMAQSGHR